MVKILLKGERVSLGIIDREMYKKVIEKLDLEVLQYFGWSKKILCSEVIDSMYNKAMEELQKERFYLFPIILNENKEIIGLTTIEIPKRNKGSIGIFLVKDFWNKGYGTKALKLLCFYSFIILGLRKLKLGVYTFNERAIKAYKKVGFREVGILREETFHMGEYRDLLLMEILAREFVEKNNEFIEKIKKLNNIVV